MTGAMYAAIGGLKSHMTKLNVIGNNIANVNTNGYKAQRMTFQESMYTTSRSGSNGDLTNGGVNPSQIGYGCSVSSIDLNMAPSTYAPTGYGLDCMLDGEGFFMVGDKTGAIRTNEGLSTLNLTRMGDFWIDAEGYVCDRRGNVLYGFATVQNPDYDPTISEPIKPKRGDYDTDAAYTQALAEYQEELEEYNTKNPKTIISTELVPLRAPLAAEVPTVANGGLIAEMDDSTPPVATGQYTERWTVNAPVYPTLGNVTDEGFQPNTSAEFAKTYAYGATDNNNNNQGGDATSARLGENTTLMPVNAQGVHIQMTDLSIEKNGAIVGTGPNGETVIIGYAAIANVDSPDAVTHVDGPYYKAMGGAGNLRVYALGGILEGKYLGNQKVIEADKDKGIEAYTPNALDSIGNYKSAEIRNGGLEASSTDLATEFSEMITTQRGYQANTRIVTVTDSMLEELVNMKR